MQSTQMSAMQHFVVGNNCPPVYQSCLFHGHSSLTDTSMEVSRRRVLQKHLEPARPLRRCLQGVIEPNVNAATCAQALMEEVHQEANDEIEQFYKIVNMHKQKEGRISYTRDFLIALANCPEARKKPEFLPEHPIVLTEARDVGDHEMMAERLHSP